MIIEKNRALMSLYMEYPGCPTTWCLCNVILLSFPRYFHPFTFIMIFGPLGAFLGSKEGVVGLVCTLIHMVHAAWWSRIPLQKLSQ